MKKIIDGYWNLFREEILKNPNIKNKDRATERYKICISCEHGQKTNTQGEVIPRKTCKVCGCVLKAKVRSATSSCPKGKW